MPDSKNDLREKLLKAQQELTAARLRVTELEAQSSENQSQFALELLGITHEALDFEAALEATLRLICTYSGWAYGEIWIPNRDRTLLVYGPVHYVEPATAQHLSAFQMASEICTFAPAEGLIGRVWESNAVEWIPDLFQLTQAQFKLREKGVEVGLHGMVAVPVGTRSQVDAVLCFGGYEILATDDSMVHLIATAAQQVGTVLRSKRTEAALKRYAQRMEILHEIDFGLIQGGSIQVLVEVTLKHLRQLVPCQRADVSIMDETTHEALVFAVGLDGDTTLGPGVRVPIPPDVFEGYDARHIRIFDDIRLFQESRPRARRLVNEGLLCALSVLLMDRERPIGVLGLFAATPGFFTAEHVEIAVEIASQLSIAIRQLDLSEALRDHRDHLSQLVEERTAELKLVKERVEAILNSSTDGILLVHSDLNIQQANSSFNSLFACEQDDYFGKSLASIVDADDVDLVTRTVQAAVAEKQGKSLEIRTLRKDGTVFDADLSIGYVKDDALVCSIRDISERKQIVAALEQQRAFLRSVIDFSPSTIFVKDYDARFVLANRLAAQLYNTTVDALIGKSDADFNPSLEEAQAFLDADRQVISSGEPLFLEEPITNFSGETRWLQTTKVPIVSVDGKSKYVLGVSTDITERKQAENALREQHEFLEQVINNVPGLIMVKDRAGRFQLVNNLVAEIHGSPLADMLGKTDADFNPNQVEVNFFVQKDRETLETGRTIFIPEETVLGRYYQTSKIPLRNRDGEHDRLLVVASDITERKKAEEALRQAFEKEKELGELKSRFVSMASHEFRTPLATILATTETLSAYRQKMTEAQIDVRLGKIREQVDHLKDIMEDVLQLARLQARRVEFNSVKLDLDAMCRSVLDEFQSRPEMTHKLLYTCDDALHEVHLDKKLMRQIISNLVSNAIKYSPDGKTIAISLAHTGNALVLQVRDEGIGIPEADLTHLFEPFHRAANVGTISGTGLGLTIIKESVELHGGTLSVDSQVGVGTTFTVNIPLLTKGKQAHDKNPGD